MVITVRSGAAMVPTWWGRVSRRDRGDPETGDLACLDNRCVVDGAMGQWGNGGMS